MTKQKDKTTMRFTRAQRDEIIALVAEIGNDGHTVWAESVLKAFPKPLQERFTRTHRSNKRDPKSTMFGADGRIIEQLKGVYGLTVLRCICDDLEISVSSYLGRGFQAQASTKAINEFFAKEPHEGKP